MPAQHPDPADVAKQTVIDRFREIAREWFDDQKIIDQCNNEIKHRQEHQAELQRRAEDCHAAARVFGFDIMETIKQQQMEIAAQTPGAAPQPPTQELPAAPPVLARITTIKDAVLDAAKHAYPKHILAADIRKQLADQGIKVHEKTIGMTLYRWLKVGAVKRDGWKWFFVPEDERKLSKPEQENPGAGAAATTPGDRQLLN